MATLTDEWHLAAAKVSPMIWEVQKAQNWTVDTAKSRFVVIPSLRRIKDYVGILSSEPEMESMRDRLVIIPINFTKAKYGVPFLVERERPVEVYDWNGDVVYEGELLPSQQAEFVKWCAGYFIRLKGLKPPRKGP